MLLYVQKMNVSRPGNSAEVSSEACQEHGAARQLHAAQPRSRYVLPMNSIWLYRHFNELDEHIF